MQLTHRAPQQARITSDGRRPYPQRSHRTKKSRCGASETSVNHHGVTARSPYGPPHLHRVTTHFDIGTELLQPSNHANGVVTTGHPC
jgi:hypothetical protein